MENLLDLVRELNGFLYKSIGESAHSFWLFTNGYYDAILFDKIVLWDNENYESDPTIKSIKTEFKKHIDEVSKIKIKL